MLAKGLQAHKRKGKAPGEGSKRARVDIPSSVTPTNATTALKVADGIKVVPTVEVDATGGAVVPPTSSSPPTKVQVSELPIEGEKREKREKEDIIIDKYALPEVVDKIADFDYEQRTWDSFKAFLELDHQLLVHIEMVNHLRSKVLKAQEDHQAAVSRLQEEKATEVDHLIKKKATKVGVP
ncbi:putative ensconsin-like [Cocos nucifera]|nr:putative ensconsin-like [Cocos nucifera]